MSEIKPCPAGKHNWRYTGTDYHGSRKDEDAYACANTGCKARAYADEIEATRPTATAPVKAGEVTQEDRDALRACQVDLLLAGANGDQNAWRRAEQAFAKHRTAAEQRGAERLEHLLSERDRFIAENGLWQKFVDQLPSANAIETGERNETVV